MSIVKERKLKIFLLHGSECFVDDVVTDFFSFNEHLWMSRKRVNTSIPQIQVKFYVVDPLFSVCSNLVPVEMQIPVRVVRGHPKLLIGEWIGSLM